MKHSYIGSFCAKCGNQFLARSDAIALGQGKYCSRACAAKSRTKTDAVTRFLSKIQKTPTCWLWVGQVQENGYGYFPVRSGHKVLAHRFAFEVFNGPIPDELNVCHKCDVRACINPEHLFLGSQKDNIQDAVAKQRMATGGRNWARTIFLSKCIPTTKTPSNTKARGSAHGMAVLTEEAVMQIKAMKETHTQAEIGKIFGISQGTISMIFSGKRWAHV